MKLFLCGNQTLRELPDSLSILKTSEDYTLKYNAVGLSCSSKSEQFKVLILKRGNKDKQSPALQFLTA